MPDKRQGPRSLVREIAPQSRKSGPGSRSGFSRHREKFFFGVPLIARDAARDWERVDHLLELTLRSVLAQTDQDFHLLLAGHDQPPCWHMLAGNDERFRFLRADWPVELPSSANDDGGCKKWLIKEAVRERGGGLLMFLDADDLVANNLVETARRLIGPRQIGGVIERGLAIDYGTLRAVELPDSRIFEGGFHQLCGSSTVARVDPGSANPMRLDPHKELGSHHVWLEAAQEAGVELVRLPLRGGYFINTAENHSEIYGPFADWRREFSAAVRSLGKPLDGAGAALFGLILDTMKASSASRTSVAAEGMRVVPARQPGEPIADR